jgi:hypothetical protein
MRLRNFLFQNTHKVVIAIAVVLGLLTIGSVPFVKNETIEASAMWHWNSTRRCRWRQYRNLRLLHTRRSRHARAGF